MRMIIAAALLLLGTQANAQLGKDASYSCAAEFAGGLAYDERTKTWMGTGLRAEEKSVLRLKFLHTRRVGGDQTVYDYNVTVDALPCARSGRADWIVPVNDRGGSFHCNTAMNSYRFNLYNNRFVSAYLLGYIYGDESNEGRPHVAAGTCTKID